MSIFIPVLGLLTVCLTFVPGVCRCATSEGSTTLKGMVAVQVEPVAVMVMEAARSGAVKRTVAPLSEESLPPVVVQVAVPPENVKFTSSPTPILVRARFAGAVATVCESIQQ